MSVLASLQSSQQIFSLHADRAQLPLQLVPSFLFFYYLAAETVVAGHISQLLLSLASDCCYHFVEPVHPVVKLALAVDLAVVHPLRPQILVAVPQMLKLTLPFGLRSLELLLAKGQQPGQILLLFAMVVEICL